MKMNHSTETGGEILAKRIHSKVDPAGTDPNRYSGYYSHTEATDLQKETSSNRNKTIIPSLKANVSNLERMLMLAAGTFLMYRAVTGKKKSIAGVMVAAPMLMRGVSGYCPLYDAAGQDGKMKSSNVNIRTTVTIDRPVSEVYSFWRKLENLPKFMKHLESVVEENAVTSEWKARGPIGIGSVSWKAQILMDEKDKMLSWQSLPGSTIDNAGKVYFKNSINNGTELDVTISYHAPLGKAGETAARFLNPIFEKMVVGDIESLKTYLETGENLKAE